MTSQIRLLDAAIQSQQVTFNRIQDAYKKKYVSDVEKNNAEMQLIDKKCRGNRLIMKFYPERDKL